MELPPPDNTYVCVCNRSFSGPGPLKLHERTCRPGRKRMREAIEKAKAVWDSQKRSRLASTSMALSQNLEDQPEAHVRQTVASVADQPENFDPDPTPVRIYFKSSISDINVCRRCIQQPIFRCQRTTTACLLPNVDHEGRIVRHRNVSEILSRNHTHHYYRRLVCMDSMQYCQILTIQSSLTTPNITSGLRPQPFTSLAHLSKIPDPPKYIWTRQELLFDGAAIP